MVNRSLWLDVQIVAFAYIRMWKRTPTHPQHKTRNTILWRRAQKKMLFKQWKSQTANLILHIDVFFHLFYSSFVFCFSSKRALLSPTRFCLLSLLSHAKWKKEQKRNVFISRLPTTWKWWLNHSYICTPRRSRQGWQGNAGTVQHTHSNRYNEMSTILIHCRPIYNPPCNPIMW